jgi:hypothetical protein
MMCLWASNKNKKKKFFFSSLTSVKKGVGFGDGFGSGAGSVAISQRYGSRDPDPNPNPHQNVTDSQYCKKTLHVDPDPRIRKTRVSWIISQPCHFLCRERSLREQQEMNRRVKERSERERQRMEAERRKEQEEELALEQVPYRRVKEAMSGNAARKRRRSWLWNRYRTAG